VTPVRFVAMSRVYPPGDEVWSVPMSSKNRVCPSSEIENAKVPPRSAPVPTHVSRPSAKEWETTSVGVVAWSRAGGSLCDDDRAADRVRQREGGRCAGQGASQVEGDVSESGCAHGTTHGHKEQPPLHAFTLPVPDIGDAVASVGPTARPGCAARDEIAPRHVQHVPTAEVSAPRLADLCFGQPSPSSSSSRRGSVVWNLAVSSTVGVELRDCSARAHIARVAIQPAGRSASGRLTRWTEAPGDQGPTLPWLDGNAPSGVRCSAWLAAGLVRTLSESRRLRAPSCPHTGRNPRGGGFRVGPGAGSPPDVSASLQ
jgi:hypothetical protein